MTSTTWRRPASIAAAALVTSALPLLMTTSPAHADTAVEKTLDYSCDLFVSLDNSDIPPDAGPFTTANDVKVGVTFTAPTLYRGATIAKTPVSVDLNLGDDKPEGLSLHFLAVTLLQGKFVTGSSTDAALELRAGDSSQKYPIAGLSVTKSPIPQDVTKDWIISIPTGLSPEIPIPDTSSVDLLAPDFFTVNATIIADKEGGGTEDRGKVRLDCTSVGEDADRTLATLPVLSTPRTTPAMTAQVRDKVVRANSTRPQLLVRTNAKPQATGAVNVYTEDRRKIATGTLNANGDVRIVLPTFGKRGSRVLVVDYVGDKTTQSRTVTTRFRVS